jgi:Flp pilus assembly protein protease CpaA
VDLRRAIVPKELTVSMLALGVLLNVVRGALLGAGEHSLWLLSGDGALLGGLDGFLLALLGFLMGFGLFFGMWILGTCGGGDVKLMAALGAWVGPRVIVFVMLGSVVVLAVMMIGRAVVGGLRPGGLKSELQAMNAGANRDGKVRTRRMTFSLPVALATALVMLWLCRVDLHLAKPQNQAQAMVTIHET